MFSLDTTDDAYQAQLAVLRRLGPEKRFAIALQMSDDARNISAEGIQRRHPSYGPEEVRYALFRLIYGDDMFCKVWPHAPLLDP